MPILYGRHLSPYVRKVLMLVDAGGIEITHRNDITPFPPSEELLAVNPRGKIPALKDGDLNLGESSVICAYLERRYGPSGLYPEDPKAYARALWFEKYVEECLMPAIGPVFYQRVLVPLLGKGVDEQAIAVALNERQPPVFELLDAALEGRQYLVGEAPSIADAAVVSAFINLLCAEAEVDAVRYPHLAAYLAFQLVRPEVARWFEAAQALTAQLREKGAELKGKA